jgi:arylsulfatase A
MKTVNNQASKLTPPNDEGQLDSKTFQMGAAPNRQTVARASRSWTALRAANMGKMPMPQHGRDARATSDVGANSEMHPFQISLLNSRSFASIRGFSVLLAVTLLVLVAPAVAAADKPNIVFILADDMGWGDVSCNNPAAAIPTPHIDRLAREGIRLTNAHAPASVCAPTRYGVLTGRYAWRTWMREGVLYVWDRALIPPTRMTIGSLLKEAGYMTGAFGKWHVGVDWVPVRGDPGDWENGTPMRFRGTVKNRVSNRVIPRIDFAQPFRNGPRQLGFDRFFGLVDNPGTPFYARDDRPVDIEVSPQGVVSPDYKRAEADDRFVDEAIALMTDARREKKPFFVYLPLSSMHHPLQAPARFNHVKGVGVRGPMIAWIDDSVRKITEALDRLGVADDTLLIFTSDNGPFYNGTIDRGSEPPRFIPSENHQPAGHFRGWKTGIWEGATRVPFAARWPGRIKAGGTSDQLICLTDMLATFAAITGDKLPKHAGEDSVSIVPVLLGENVVVRESMITHSYTGVVAIRQDSWKLILDTKGSGGIRGTAPDWQPIVTSTVEQIGVTGVGQLYNLADDPAEQNDVYERRPDIVKQLIQLLAVQRDTGRSRP